MNGRSVLKKLIGGLFVIAVVVYLGYQLAGSFISRVDTEQAVLYTACESVFSDGYMARQELLIPSNGSTMEILAQNGAMVSAGQPLAAYYSNEADAAVRLQVSEIEGEIKQLEAINSTEGAKANISGVEKDIAESIYSLCRIVSDQKTYKAYDIKQNLEVLLAKIRATDGGNEKIEARLSELKKERSSLASKITGTVRYEYAPKPGYFSSVVDGYEPILTPEFIQNLTAEQYSTLGIKPQLFLKDYAGKLVTSYNWYFATTLDREYVTKMPVGKQYKVRFTGSSSYDLNAVVKKINYNENDTEALFVFEFDRFPEDILFLRNQNAEIILKRVEGIKVPKSAIRILEGKKGVYCLIGAQSKFKKVETIYEGSNYFLVKQGTNENDLLVMDDIITNGKNIYDGKMVK